MVAKCYRNQLLKVLFQNKVQDLMNPHNLSEPILKVLLKRQGLNLTNQFHSILVHFLKH